MSEKGAITRLAERWSEGDRDAFDELVALAYDDLRRIAHHHLRAGRRDGGLDTTALAHEAYLKLAAVEDGSWRSRAHFCAFCSKGKRRILIDHARHQHAAKRGGDRVRVALTPGVSGTNQDTAELLALNEALERLEARDPRLAQIVDFARGNATRAGERLAAVRPWYERQFTPDHPERVRLDEVQREVAGRGNTSSPGP